MNCKRAIIYLDFDGVIAHSALECIDTAVMAYSKVAANRMQEDLDPALLEVTVNLAIQNRYLVLPPENFFCLIKAAQKCAAEFCSTSASIEKEFRKELEITDRSILDYFKRQFFLVRENNAITSKKGAWYRKNPETIFIRSLMANIENIDVGVEIISRKDESSLRRWVSESPYEFDSIYGNQALGKFENNKFKLIAELQSAREENYALFVDDAVDELIDDDWDSVRVRPLIAGWGYNKLEDNTDFALQFIEEWLNDLSH